MVARLDWFNDGIERMLADKHPLTPDEWVGGAHEGVRTRDIDMLRYAAGLNSLRPGADMPRPDFVEALRARVLQEAEQQ